MRKTFLAEFGYKRQFELYLKLERKLTVLLATANLQLIISKDPPKCAEGIAAWANLNPLSGSTVHIWMHACGCLYEKATATYYTDSHENPTTILDRKNRYLPAQMQAWLREAVWVNTPFLKATEPALNNRREVLQAGEIEYFEPVITSENPNPYIKVHVDFLDEDKFNEYRAYMLRTYNRPGDYFYDLGAEEWQNFPCRHRHDPENCKCKLPLYHTGQDEAVFKQNALPAYFWSVKGRTTLRPKTEGQGIMVSAFQCETRGFGLPLSEADVNKINEHRRINTSLPPIDDTSSAGCVFFRYGNAAGKEGYWDGIKFKQQCKELVDIVEILEPNKQILIEVDHSSGHFKELDNGLMVNAMGLNHSGTKSHKRDTKIEIGCLGADPPLVNGTILGINDIQTMTFPVGSDPPFNDLKAKPYDTNMDDKQIVREKEKRKNAKVKADARKIELAALPYSIPSEENVEEVELPFIIEGYIGKNKGIYQVN